MSFSKQTVQDVPLEDSVVLVRADYNVPIRDGKISDDLRIRASIPTLRYLLDEGCTIVIMSHLGRPKGVVDEALSLEPVAQRLESLLGVSVDFVDACYGDKVSQAVRSAHKGSVILLENLRFHSEEEQNDMEFAQKIAKSSRARYFVQDGFGVVHRAHASTEAIAQCLPGVAGLLLEKEVKTITTAMQNPKRPFCAVLGGAKISDKITVIEAFVQKADKILIGGAMANTFLAYKGKAVGKSKTEPDQSQTLDKIYWAAGEKVGGENIDDFIILPEDVAVAKSVSRDEAREVVTSDEIAEDDIALDIGDRTIERFSDEIAQAKTVIWNGPLGYSEFEAFAHGSARMALSLASRNDCDSIIGGGDTADFVLKWDGHDGKSFTHISTGGGASLDLMAGKTLPGVAALLDAKR